MPAHKCSCESCLLSCSCRPVRSVSCPPSQSERVATPACRVRQLTALPRPSSSSASTNTRQHSTRIRLDTCVGNCCLFVCLFIDRGRLSPPPCYINRTGIIFRPFSGYRPLHYRRFSRFYGTQKQRRIGVLGGGRSARRAASSAHAKPVPPPPPTARCCAQRAGPRGICRCARTTGAPLAKQLPTEPPTTRPKRWCVPVRSGSHYGARTGRFAAKIAQNPMLRGLPTHKSDS